MGSIIKEGAHMADNQEVVAKLQQALAVAARCSTAETAANYEILNEELQELAALAKRESQSHADCAALTRKLRAGQALTADEMATLKLMIVGDAEYYLKYDEEFEQCKSSLSKILAKIQGLQANELGVDALMHLAVLCQEACSMLVPTEHYLEQKDRLSKFETATRGSIDRDTGRALANVIDEMTRQ
jgi:hypothetical protein